MDDITVVNNMKDDLKAILSFADYDDYKLVIKNYLAERKIKCKDVIVVKTKPTNDKRAKEKIIINIYLTITKNWNIEIVLAVNTDN